MNFNCEILNLSPRDARPSARDNGAELRSAIEKIRIFLQKDVRPSIRSIPSSSTIILASIQASFLLCSRLLAFFVWSVVVDLLIAQWMGINNLRTKVLLLFKLIHIMDDHKLETIQQTEVKRRMPSACCYLPQDFLFSPRRHSLVSC